MIVQASAGALVGLGLYALVVALAPARTGLSAKILRIDAIRQQGPVPLRGVEPAAGSGIKDRLGARLADLYAAQGWQQRSLKADLSLLGRSWPRFLGTKVLLAAGATVFAPLLFPSLAALGLHLPVTVPLWLALLFGTLAFMAPDVEVRRDAAVKRRDFRRVVGAYLDLVAMNLAGGRGLPEALMSAAEVGDGWALQRVRDALVHARITGITQWDALGRLGEELAVDELKDLASALTLVADDGAKIRASLSARAATLRHRELSEIEGQAGKQSQSMLVAQMLLAAGFLVFLTYPAASRIFEL
jgi:Flp pilus assembly protein TadB